MSETAKQRYVYNGREHPFTELDYIIKDAIDALPEGCKANHVFPDVGVRGDHKWELTFGSPPTEKYWPSHKFHKEGLQPLPYYVCKHCHAVSNPIGSDTIVRVR